MVKENDIPEKEEWIDEDFGDEEDEEDEEDEDEGYFPDEKEEDE